MSYNRTRTDNTIAEIQTYFGGNSNGLVNILTWIESLWFYIGLRMGNYVSGNHHDRSVITVSDRGC